MVENIGERINRDVLGYERADYGKQIVATVSRQLQNIYGHKGFDVKSLYRRMQFATLFPYSQIVSTASRQLSWSHFVELLPLKDGLQREYYFTLASANRWSVRQLRKEIDGMLYERTALSSKPLILRKLHEHSQHICRVCSLDNRNDCPLAAIGILVVDNGVQLALQGSLVYAMLLACVLPPPSQRMQIHFAFGYT